MNNIKFLGNFSDGTLKKACKQRENPTSLDTFYNAVNQATASRCCSCCKQEVIVYAVELPIKPAVLSLCVECLSSLPLALEVINLSSHGAPPLLVQMQKDV